VDALNGLILAKRFRGNPDHRSCDQIKIACSQVARNRRHISLGRSILCIGHASACDAGQQASHDNAAVQD